MTEHIRPMSCATMPLRCIKFVRERARVGHRYCAKPMPCPDHGGPPAEEPKLRGEKVYMTLPPAEDNAYRITPAQELDLAEEELRWVMADWLHSRQRRRLREVLRAIKAARAGLA